MPEVVYVKQITFRVYLESVQKSFYLLENRTVRSATSSTTSRMGSVGIGGNSGV